MVWGDGKQYSHRYSRAGSPERAHGDTPVATENLRQFHRFNLLMEEHYAEHWPLQRYADELGLTTAHLNIICRRLANMSYKQLIFKRLLQEAKRFLLHRKPVS